MRHFEGFANVQAIVDEFQIPADHPLIPTNEEILFANYCCEGYEGDARILFQRNGVLYEVEGSHCSCMGLEDQWNPIVVSWEQLGMRNYTYFSRDRAKKEFMALVHSHCPRA